MGIKNASKQAENTGQRFGPVQVELDNTADEFRRLHAERQDLVRQWQDAVDGMRRRDDEMNAIGEKYAKTRRMRAEKIETLSQNVARLKMQTDNNEEVRKRADCRGNLVPVGSSRPRYPAFSIVLVPESCVPSRFVTTTDNISTLLKIQPVKSISTIGGGQEYDDSVPGEVTKTAPSGDRTT